MKARVQVSDQVLAYIGKLAPQPRKRLRDASTGLQKAALT